MRVRLKMTELKQPLRKNVEKLINDSDEEYYKGNYINSIKLLERAWDALPEPKEIYDDSFHLCKFIVETYLLIKDYNKAKVWANRIMKCDLERIDSGEREFLHGKIHFELNEFDDARKFFKIASQKSEGRCFEDEDKKYFKFFKKEK
jgi:tetratricopeptide (TPR) repeat protein